MATYLASDVHLRLDRPERGRRFARFVGRLGATDFLVLGGDLCDFWFASRQANDPDLPCPGLRALVDFRRRGGRLALIAGNHDAGLGSFYQQVLGIGFEAEPLEIETSGVRVHLVHGHRLGARPWWKAGLESRAFLRGFSQLPGAVATGLGALLDRSNERGRAAADERFLATYRRYADSLADRADFVVFGHIHGPRVEETRRPKLVVLGGWHRRSSYLKIDETGARLIVEED